MLNTRTQILASVFLFLTSLTHSLLSCSVCLVALAARSGSKATGLFCKWGSEMCILTNQLLISSEPVACFATAEFFISGACTAQHTVKLNPQVLFEQLDYSKMTLIGFPKSGRPKFHDEENRGKMQELPPTDLCADPDFYPYVGETCDLVGHPFGNAKEKHELVVSGMNERKGIITFKVSATTSFCFLLLPPFALDISYRAAFSKHKVTSITK